MWLCSHAPAGVSSSVALSVLTARVHGPAQGAARTAEEVVASPGFGLNRMLRAGRRNALLEEAGEEQEDGGAEGESTYAKEPGPTAEERFFSFAEEGPIGLCFVPHTVSVPHDPVGSEGEQMEEEEVVAILRVVPGSVASREEHAGGLLAGMVLTSVQRRSVHGVPYARVQEMMTSAGRPLVLGFGAPPPPPPLPPPCTASTTLAR
jgi:hypothetical protein